MGCYGTGAGFEFQKLAKGFPQYACETAALTLRNAADHYGPVERREVELRAEADHLLTQVQNYVDGMMLRSA
jgi:hypothetical protein